MNIIGAGINIYADTGQAENALMRMGRRQMDLIQNSRIFAREVPSSFDKAFAPMQRFNTMINRNYTSIERFRYETRRLTNELNSLVMAGVAVSMTGVSFMNFGRTVTGGFTQAIKQATAFEKTMKEIEFIGGLKGQVKEMKKVQNEVMKIGISLPTTNQKVAEGMLESMKAGFNTKEALKLAPIMSELAFLSFDKMTESDGLKMMNSWLKTTGKNVDSARGAFDKFTKTADLFTTDLDGINRAFQSTRAAYDTMQLGKQKMGEESFLALIGMMSTQHNPRASGMMMNSFSRGLAQATGSDAGTKRGDLWRALGIDYEAEDDILATMDKISKASIRLWGDTKSRQEKLIDLFGVEGLPVLQMMEKYAKTGKDIFELRDGIKDSSKYSKEYMKHIMKTSFGTQKILEGTKETLVTLIGLSVLEPVNKILWGVSKALGKITEFAQKHPQLTKFISLLVLSVGVLSMVAGAALLVGGAFMAMYGSIASAIVTMGQLGMTTDVWNKGITSLGGSFRNSMINPMKNIIFSMGRMMLLSGLLYLSWKHDFMGMRTAGMKFFNSFKEGRKLAQQLFSDPKMSWDKFMEIKKKKDPLTGWFADKFVKAKALGMLLKGLWKDGKITASDVGGEKEFQRLYKIWEGSGMLEIADTILDWKHNIEAFWVGFMKGGEIARKFIAPIFHAIGDVLVWIYDTVTSIGKHFGFIKNDADGLAPTMEKIGVVLGTIVGIAGGIALAFKAWRLTLGPIASLLGGMGRLLGKFGLFRLFKGKGPGGPGGPNPIKSMFNPKTISLNIRKGIRDGLKGTRRIFVKAMLLDKLMPSVFGQDGGVKNPARSPINGQNAVLHRSSLHQAAWNRTKNRTQPQPKKLSDIGRYSQFTQTGKRGPVSGGKGQTFRTLNSTTKMGVLKDFLFGRKLDVQNTPTGRTAVRTPAGGMRFVGKNGLQQGVSGSVRTGRGLIGRSIIGRTGQLVGRKAMQSQAMMNMRTGFQMLGNNTLFNNMRRQSGRVQMNTTGVAGARPGQQYMVQQRGGMGGAFDTFFGSKTYDQQGNRVGRTKGVGANTRFKAQGRLGKGVGSVLNAGKMFAGFTSNALKFGPKIGKVLLKGITIGMKVGLRAIPIIGELLLAWDLICLVWSNWDAIKAGAAKFWNWLKEIGSKIWTWMKDDGLRILGGIVTGVVTMFTGLPKLLGKAFSAVGSALGNALQSGYQSFLNKHPNLAKILPGEAEKKKGHRTGLYKVPGDGYPALLHSGEMVLTQREAQVLRAMSGTKSIFDTLTEAKKGYRTGGTIGPSIKPKVTSSSSTSSSGNGGNVSINFTNGSVQISVQNMTNEAELEKGARKMFEKFKRMVELENVRNYRPAR